MVKFGRHLQFLRQDQRTPAYLVEYKRVSTLVGQEDAFSAAWFGTRSKNEPRQGLVSAAQEAEWPRLAAPRRRPRGSSGADGACSAPFWPNLGGSLVSRTHQCLQPSHQWSLAAPPATQARGPADGDRRILEPNRRALAACSRRHLEGTDRRCGRATWRPTARCAAGPPYAPQS